MYIKWMYIYYHFCPEANVLEGGMHNCSINTANENNIRTGNVGKILSSMRRFYVTV